MAHDVKLPSLSAGMEDAVISRWLVATGDSVTKGQAIAEVETEKATMELEAEAEGTIGELRVKDGARADVGQIIAVILGQGESLSAAPVLAAAAPAAAPATVVAAPAPLAGPGVLTSAAELATRPAASPLARKLALQAGVDLASLTGSGPRGRIVRIDVEAAAAAKAAAPAPETASVAAPVAAPSSDAPKGTPAGIGPHEVIALTSMRRTIARRLTEAKSTVPHFYLEADCRMDALLDLRAQINEGRDKAARVSVNDLVIKACARALRQLPEANAVWNGDEILRLSNVDIAVAVSTEGGLITPILRQADRMSLGTVSSEMKALALRARDGKLKPEEYQGGGFSISNLGMYGVKRFTAIINPPQSAILAVGAAEETAVSRGGVISSAQVMALTLSVDHRSIDGALGAELLAAIKDGLERPMELLL